MKDSIERLKQMRDLPDELLLQLIDHEGDDTALFEAADQVRREHYGTDVFLRGLIEFTNYCKNDCYYCGIRRSNRCAERYWLTP